MAVIATFKQKCPSCEAMVSIKDTMIGKKVECTKCKDKFIAKRPKEVEEDLEVEIDEDDAPAKSGKKGAATNGKRPKMELAPGNGKAKGTNGKANGKSNGKLKKADADDDDDEDGGKKKKKKQTASNSSNKLVIGLGLAVVGVLILGIAAFFLMRNPGGGGGGGGKFPGPQGPGGEQVEEQKEIPKKFDLPTPPAAAAPLNDAEIARLSNLLPGDADHVFALYLANVFSQGSTLRNAAFESAGALDDAVLRRRMGFGVLGIDHMILAERYGPMGWRYSVLHFKDVLSESELKTALNLESAGSAIDGQSYYKITKPHPAFDQLARFSFGVPNTGRNLDKRGERPTFVRVHNPQTLIVGDQAPVQAFLRAKGQFPLQSNRQPPGPDPKKVPPGGDKTKESPMPMPMPMPMMPPDMTPSTDPNPPKTRPDPRPGGPGRPAGGVGDASELEDNGVHFTLFQQPGRGGPPPIPGGPTPPTQGGPPPGRPGGKGGPPPIPGDPTPPTPGGPTPGGPTPGGPGGKGGPPPIPGGPMPMPPTPGGPGGQEKQPPEQKDPPAGPSGRDDMYLTVKPSLKAMLDRMETRGADKEKILFSSATDMDANTVSSKETANDGVVRIPRQFWDVTLLLRESRPRIRLLGTGLVQKDTLKFQLRNEINCAQEFDAREFQRDINDRAAFHVAKFLSQVVKHDVKLPSEAVKKDPASDPLFPGGETKQDDKKASETTSQITVKQQDKNVEFVLDLVLDNAVLTQAHAIMTLAASVLRAEIDAASILSLRHQLATAGKVLGEKGSPSQRVGAGNFPPGAFPRADAKLYTDKEPRNRISWMAALLPYMGHKNVHDRLQFDVSWRDPGNWLAAHASIPQFLDPSYPNSARYAAVAGLPMDFAATHYVGIAGVGLDAANYKRGDPATANKRGVFSYDGAAALTEVMAGRGTSNTILMIQVPHDRGAGVSPWIAGGGATLRGVPEKNSIEPFILGKDRNGKTVGLQGKKGTFVLMTDGSVRFIEQTISDDVFKAMCTIEGGTPEKFDLKTDPNTPLVPAPDAKETPSRKPEAKPSEKTPEVKSPADGKKSIEENEKKAPADSKKAADEKTEKKAPDGKLPLLKPSENKTPENRPNEKSSFQRAPRDTVEAAEVATISAFSREKGLARLSSI